MRSLTILSLLGVVAAITLNAAVVSAQANGCKEYYSRGVMTPQIETLSDTVTVSDGFPLSDVTLTLDVSHRRIGGLVVSLTATPPQSAGADVATRKVVLKERGLGQLGDNMYMTTFSDASPKGFPGAESAAPFQGKFRPTQRLSFLIDGANATTTMAGAGGSQGDWTLRIEDVAPNATIRPIALNGWMLRLCPASIEQQPPQASVPTATPSPDPAVEDPAVESLNGPAPGPTPAPAFKGWRMVMSPGGVAALEEEMAAGTGTQTYAADVVPPVNPAFGGLNLNFNGGMLSSFQQNFNSFLQGMFGQQCTDASCSNIKLKFWKAALGIAYINAKRKGIEPSHIMDKLAELLPGDNPLLGKLTGTAEAWEAKRTELLRGIAVWYDSLLARMQGDVGGMEALMSNMLSGEGLEMLGIDPAAAAEAVGPMFGLQGDEAKALMEGLRESDFPALLADVFGPDAISGLLS